jgi:WD40 repeat protein
VVNEENRGSNPEEAERLKAYGLLLRNDQEFDSAILQFEAAQMLAANDPDLPRLISETREIPDLRLTMLLAEGPAGEESLLAAAKRLREIGFLAPRLARMEVETIRLRRRRVLPWHLRFLAPGPLEWCSAAAFATLALGCLFGYAWMRLSDQWLFGLELRIPGVQIGRAALSPDGKRVLAAGYQEARERIYLWDVHNGVLLRSLRGRRNWIRTAALAPNCRLALSGGSIQNLTIGEDEAVIPDNEQEYSVSLWNLETGEEKTLFQTTQIGGALYVQTAAFSSDNRLLAFNIARTIQIVDVASLEVLREFEDQDAFVRALVFSPDSRLLLSGAMDGALILWNVESGQAETRIKGHDNVITGVAFSPDGSKFLSASWDRTIRVWETGTGRRLKTLEGHPGRVNSAAFVDNHHIISGGGEGTVRIWDVETGKETARFTISQSEVLGVTASSDGKTALATTDGGIRIWDLVKD